MSERSFDGVIAGLRTIGRAVAEARTATKQDFILIPAPEEASDDH
jgi:hypothetical protein